MNRLQAGIDDLKNALADVILSQNQIVAQLNSMSKKGKPKEDDWKVNSIRFNWHMWKKVAKDIILENFPDSKYASDMKGLVTKICERLNMNNLTDDDIEEETKEWQKQVWL